MLECSAARALEVVGESWSLLILRDALFRGYTRFGDFERSLGIAPNILAKRLEGFVAAGVSRAPFRFMAIHAIELHLNGALLASEQGPAALRRMHHDLGSKVDLVVAAGLKLRRRTGVPPQPLDHPRIPVDALRPPGVGFVAVEQALGDPRGGVGQGHPARGTEDQTN